MNEAQVRHDLIDPTLMAAGWESLPAKASDKNYRAGEAQARKYAAALNYYSDIQRWLYAA